MKFIISSLLIVNCLLFSSLHGADKKREYYQLTLYHFTTAEQEKIIDNYLKNSLLPALHKLNMKDIGVFKPIANDTAKDKIIYILVPLVSTQQMVSLPLQLLKDKEYVQSGKEYLEAAYNNPPYQRIENLLLKAFPLAPKMILPNLSGPRAERIYEFRSYESATEALYRNKVKMFNEGGEISLFKRLEFNAIFYAEVISGGHMPNLTYMTSFENMEERTKHWKTFVEDAEWKNLSSMQEYKNNVSKINIVLMNAADYSDY